MFQILVVEDDRELSRTVCEFLNRSGYAATAYDAMYDDPGHHNIRYDQFPVYNYVTQKERERVAPEILKLTDELMN